MREGDRAKARLKGERWENRRRRSAIEKSDASATRVGRACRHVSDRMDSDELLHDRSMIVG